MKTAGQIIRQYLHDLRYGFKRQPDRVIRATQEDTARTVQPDTPDWVNRVRAQQRASFGSGNGLRDTSI